MRRYSKEVSHDKTRDDIHCEDKIPGIDITVKAIARAVRT